MVEKAVIFVFGCDGSHYVPFNCWAETSKMILNLSLFVYNFNPPDEK